MGLERLTSILQQKRSNYDSDVFTPLFKDIENIIGCGMAERACTCFYCSFLCDCDRMVCTEPYTGRVGADDKDFKDTAYRVIADHIRTIAFAVSDGALPRYTHARIQVHIYIQFDMYRMVCVQSYRPTLTNDAGSNEGRGYVLRRILRRALRFGLQTLGAAPDSGFFEKCVDVCVNNFSGAFPGESISG
jgi:alanyl-tRNA synthetase